MDLVRTPITLIIYHRPPAKKRRPPPASANDRSQRIAGVLPNWERKRSGSTQPVSARRRLETPRESYTFLFTLFYC